jgi:hypothetical protein
MGLMDKVKAQATQVAAKAQEAGKVGQAKLEGVQAKRKADSLLEELGKISYEAQVGRGGAGDQGRAADLVEQLRQYEAEYGQIGVDPAPAASSAPMTSTFIPSAGPEPETSSFIENAAPEPAAPAFGASSAPTIPSPSVGGIPESGSFGEGEL